MSRGGIGLICAEGDEPAGAGAGELAEAEEAVVVGAADAPAEARAELAGFDLAAADPAADGLPVGTDVAGDVGDGEELVGPVGGDLCGHGSLLAERQCGLDCTSFSGPTMGRCGGAAALPIRVGFEPSLGIGWSCRRAVTVGMAPGRVRMPSDRAAERGRCPFRWLRAAARGGEP